MPVIPKEIRLVREVIVSDAEQSGLVLSESCEGPELFEDCYLIATRCLSVGEALTLVQRTIARTEEYGVESHFMISVYDLPKARKAEVEAIYQGLWDNELVYVREYDEDVDVTYDGGFMHAPEALELLNALQNVLATSEDLLHVEVELKTKG